MSEFHHVGVTWQPGRIGLYYDGNLVHEHRVSRWMRLLAFFGLASRAGSVFAWAGTSRPEFEWDFPRLVIDAQEFEDAHHDPVWLAFCESADLYLRAMPPAAPHGYQP